MPAMGPADYKTNQGGDCKDPVGEVVTCKDGVIHNSNLFGRYENIGTIR